MSEKKDKKGIVAEFREFVSRGNVMNLAVGVIIGGAFQAIVSSLVADIISPLIGAIGGMDFAQYSIILREAVTDSTGAVVTEAVCLNYGSFINAIINFLLMAVIIFLLVKFMNSIMNIGKKEKKDEEPEKPAVKTCPFCKSEISAEATRCPHCTSELPEAE